MNKNTQTVPVTFPEAEKFYAEKNRRREARRAFGRRLGKGVGAILNCTFEKGIPCLGLVIIASATTIGIFGGIDHWVIQSKLKKASAERDVRLAHLELRMDAAFSASEQLCDIFQGQVRINRQALKNAMEQEQRERELLDARVRAFEHPAPRNLFPIWFTNGIVPCNGMVTNYATLEATNGFRW